MTDTNAEVLRKSLKLLEKEHKNGDITDAEFEESKARYLSLGVELIEEEQGDVRVVSRNETRAKSEKFSFLRRVAVWVVLALVVVGITVAVLANNKSDRQDGDAITGNVSQSSNDVLSRANDAQANGDLAGALKLYDQVLATDPNNIDALSSRGWTLYLASTAVAETDPAAAQTLSTQSIDSLNKAVAIDATYGPARAWRGVVRFRGLGDNAGAIQDFDAYLANASNDSLRPLVQAARDEASR